MAKNKLSSHDHYIRQIMTNPKVAHEFFETHLPERIKEIVDLSTLELQKESYLDDKLRLQIVDLLYTVKVNEEPGYIYTLIEHMSTYDRLLPFRMLKYMIAIMEHHLKKTGTKKLPFIFPMIVYTGKDKYPYSLDLFDLFENNKELAKQTLFEPCKLLDISNTPDEELQKFLMFGTIAQIMKHVHDPSFEPFLEQLMQFLKKLDENGEEEYINVSISYIVETAEIPNKSAFINAVKTLKSIDEDKIMTLAEQWKQEGIHKAAHDIALNLLKIGM
jgi:predicted transposase/invertase (TIGR01784 family)